MGAVVVEELTLPAMSPESPDPPETDPVYVFVGQAFARIRGKRHVELDARTLAKIEGGQIDVGVRSHHSLARMLGTTLDAVHQLARELDPRVEPTPDQDRDRLLQVAQAYAEPG